MNRLATRLLSYRFVSTCSALSSPTLCMAIHRNLSSAATSVTSVCSFRSMPGALAGTLRMADSGSSSHMWNISSSSSSEPTEELLRAPVVVRTEHGGMDGRRSSCANTLVGEPSTTP